MNDVTHHTAKAAVVLLGGRSLPQAVLRRGTALKIEGIEEKKIGNHQRQLWWIGAPKNQGNLGPLLFPRHLFFPKNVG